MKKRTKKQQEAERRKWVKRRKLRGGQGQGEEAKLVGVAVVVVAQAWVCARARVTRPRRHSGSGATSWAIALQRACPGEWPRRACEDARDGAVRAPSTFAEYSASWNKKKTSKQRGGEAMKKEKSEVGAQA